jgi:alanine-synthesizing transaminase
MRGAFSARTSWDLGESGLSGAIRSARANGLELFDLTISNPTVCGFRYEVQGILGALQRAEAMVYDPDPRGMWVAREAVATYYADAGVEVSPAECLLTTSTSEAYSFLFRLLCDAGDEVLVAQPSYPLFDFLASLDDVRLESYPLFYDYGSGREPVLCWSCIRIIRQGMRPLAGSVRGCRSYVCGMDWR